MRKLNILVLLVVVTLFSACSLDEKPETSFLPGDISTPEDVNALLLSVYSGSRANYTGSLSYYLEYPSDLFTETTNSGNRGGFLYRWTINSTDKDAKSVWLNSYATVANANLVIESIDRILPNYAEDASSLEKLNNYKAEALLWRAILHRRLALIYSVDYEPTTASNEYGIPFQESFKVEARRARGTLEETYQHILDDIKEAESLMTATGVSAPQANSTRLTIDCIPALKTQVYVDMHKYAEAITEADKIINKYPLVNSKTELEAMWREDVSTETIFQVGLTKDELGYSYSDLSGIRLAADKSYLGTGGVIPTRNYTQLFDYDKDWRVDVYVQEAAYQATADATKADATLFIKHIGNKNLRTTPEAFNYRNMAKIFTIADIILLKAEAQYRTSGDAAATLNKLRAGRGLDPVSGGDIFKEIQNERVREMTGSGGRIADIKRWKIDVTRMPQVMPEGIIAVGETHNRTIKHNEDKIVFPIPHHEFTVNPNIAGQQNPGYAE